MDVQVIVQSDPVTTGSILLAEQSTSGKLSNVESNSGHLGGPGMLR